LRANRPAHLRIVDDPGWRPDMPVNHCTSASSQSRPRLGSTRIRIGVARARLTRSVLH
jgi:hypothetical protein